MACLNGDENMIRTLYLARANASLTDNEGGSPGAVVAVLAAEV